MSFKERVIHSFLFEIFAILITIIALKFTTQNKLITTIGVSLTISFTAVVWNFIFNIFFDKIFNGPRIERGVGIRVIHATLFEFGLLAFTIPFVSYVMNVSFIVAFLLNIGLTLTILVFAIVYNWVYDRIRLFFTNKS